MVKKPRNGHENDESVAEEHSKTCENFEIQQIVSFRFFGYWTLKDCVLSLSVL